jgi:hypothetical protein
MTQETVTTDLANFGFREIKMAAELLQAWVSQGLPDDFDNDEVRIHMNTNSGNVFLSNSNFDVAMMNGEDLESFYTCPECGHEGFKDEMLHAGNSGCAEYLESIGAAVYTVQVQRGETWDFESKHSTLEDATDAADAAKEGMNKEYRVIDSNEDEVYNTEG